MKTLARKVREMVDPHQMAGDANSTVMHCKACGWQGDIVQGVDKFAKTPICKSCGSQDLAPAKTAIPANQRDQEIQQA